jgi:hypothetical protein
MQPKEGSDPTRAATGARTDPHGTRFHPPLPARPYFTEKSLLDTMLPFKEISTL